MNFPAFLALAALALAAALVVAHLARGERRPQRVLLILAVLILGAAQLSLFLMLLSRAPKGTLADFRGLIVFSILFPAAGLPFLASFGRKGEREILAGRMPWILAAVIILASAAFVAPASLFVRKLFFGDDGSFWGIAFSGYGKLVAVYLLSVNVFFLFLFENIYRAATVAHKVILKYPLLGAILASVINFAVMSRILALAIVDRNFLAVLSCGVIILCVSFLYASVRYKLGDVRVAISPQATPSTLSVVVAGLYLFALGIITLFAELLGLPYDQFIATVLGIFAAFLLIAVLISGKAKKRVRLFLSENFYFTRYNYRKEWRRYAEIMAAGSNLGDFLSNVISALCDTMLVKRGFVRVDAGGGKAAFYGVPEETYDERLYRELVRLTARTPVVIVTRTLSDGAETDWGWIRAAARLGQADECEGLIVLGEKNPPSSYTDEDENFLGTIAHQATLVLDNIIMEERIIEARQMESFNQFASFVVHDLKNTVGMLSLVAENARENIASAEFQRDALETIRRSVDKMRKLITSLSVHKMPTSLARSETDVTALVERLTGSLKEIAAARGVTLEFSGEPRVRAVVDAAAVARVVENIILNAVEASKEGSSVKVKVGAAADERTTIAVLDSAGGFDPDYLGNHLFRPFHSTKKGGLGIGLVLCKSLVEAHGGKLVIASRRGEGSTVSVILPAVRDTGSD